MNHSLSKRSLRNTILLSSVSRSRSIIRYFRKLSGTKETFITTILIDINTDEVSIDPNKTAPKHIVISSQEIDDPSTLSRNARSSTSNSNSSISVTQ